MFDIRHHIALLTTALLGLTLGMVIGMSLFAPEQVSRQGKQIADLKIQVGGAEHAKDQLDKMEDSLDSIRPGLVRGKLPGKKVVIIQTGDYPEAAQAAASAIHDAGATVVASMVINGALNELTPKQRADVLLALPGGNADGESDPPAQDGDNTRILYAIADAVAEGTGTSQANKRALATLEAQGLITMTGDLPLPATFCVLVGGTKDDVVSGVANPEPRKPIDGILIGRLRESSAGQMRMAGCETFNAAISSIPTYQKYGVPSVDCIDRPLGALDLPFALRGKSGEAGDYGLKTTASRRVPASLEEAASS